MQRRAACSGRERAVHLVELLDVADAALDQVSARPGWPARTTRLGSRSYLCQVVVLVELAARQKDRGDESKANSEH